MSTSQTASPSKRLRLLELQEGRDEMNIAEFPIAVLGDRAPRGTKTLQFQDTIWDQHAEKPVTRKLVIQGTDRLGLPTAKDDEVLLGLIQLTRLENNFSDRKVQFSRYELLRLLGWSDEGKSYRRLEEALHRWASVYLSYEKAWWDNRRKSWVDEGFHILERITMYEREKGKASTSQASLPFSSFTWSEVFFRSFQDGYLKALDLGFFQGLESSTAKRMYRFLDKHFYRRSRLEYELRDLAFEHVGLSRDYHTGKIKEKLAPAIAELEGKGYLEPMAPAERYHRMGRGSWRVVFVKKGTTAREKDMPEGDLLAKELIDRGVTAGVAAELVAAFPAELITAKLELFDWMVEKSDKRLSQNPAGYLVASIRGDYAAPQGFEPKADREQKKKAADDKQKANQKKRDAERRQERHDAARKTHVRNMLDGIPLEEREELERDAIANADPAWREAIEQKTIGADFALTIALEKEILRRFPFPELQAEENQLA